MSSAWERFKQEVGGMLREEAAFALKDIRQKVVEKGWFGEVVTPRGNELQNWEPQPERAMFNQADVFNAFKEGKELTREDLYGREPDHGIDR